MIPPVRGPAGGVAARAWVGLRQWLPEGGLLPGPEWANRHRGILILLWLHVPGLALFGLVVDKPSLHALLETSVVGMFAVCAAVLRRRLAAILAATLGLFSASAVLVHLSGGVVEAHFHFFVMVGVVALYQDWRPFLLGIAYVVIHHGLAGAIDPTSVFNHQAAAEHPWRWAGIHGGFTLAMSAVGTVTWKLSESALKDASRRAAQLGEAQAVARLGSWERDEDGGLTWSDELYRLLGLPTSATAGEEAFLAQVVDEDRDRVAVHLAEGRRGRSDGVDFRVRTADGLRWLHAQTAPTSARGQAGTAQDITERIAAESRREALEAQLQHSQRLKSLGQLAGGVAHDFKNLLSVIAWTVDILAEEPDAETRDQDLAHIREAATRGVELSRQLLLFSRMDPPASEPLDLVAELERITVMLRRTVPASVDIEVRTDPSLPQVCISPSRLDQALVNLVVNARDAMADGGRVVIAASPLTSGPEELGLGRGPYVEVSVSDNGTGMSAEVVERAFDPFFTTKGPGEGTGLGLSIVHGVVTGAGGAIAIDSKPGEGTTVRLYLPAAEQPAAAASRRPDAAPATGAGEVVLVVEDEATVRALAARMLTGAGYRTLEAGGPVEALELLARSEVGVDVVLSDVIMPGMSGGQFAERLARSHPGLPVIFMSGYTGGDVDLGDPSLTLLEKPFTRDDLLAAVAARLTRNPASALHRGTVGDGRRRGHPFDGADVTAHEAR